MGRTGPASGADAGPARGRLPGHLLALVLRSGRLGVGAEERTLSGAPQSAGRLGQPVADGVPVFRLVRAAGGEVLSGSPYAGSDPPYDGRTTRWELLGYAYEAGTEPAAPAGFDSVPIEDVLPAAGYRAEGRSLRVLCRAQPLPDAGGDEDAATIDGSLDVTAIDAPTLPEDGPATPHAPAADAGCGCRTDARGGRGCLFLVLVLVALHGIRARRIGRETDPTGRRTEPTARASMRAVRVRNRRPLPRPTTSASSCLGPSGPAKRISRRSSRWNWRPTGPCA